MTEMEATVIKKCRAIVMFGPATPNSGMRAGTYYQVTIDPEMVSPTGEFIRFGASDGDEINGWQRVDAMTVCEILGEFRADGSYPDASEEVKPLRMMVLT